MVIAQNFSIRQVIKISLQSLGHILPLGPYCTEFLYFYLFSGQSSGRNKTNSMHFRKKMAQITATKKISFQHENMRLFFFLNSSIMFYFLIHLYLLFKQEKEFQFRKHNLEIYFYLNSRISISFQNISQKLYDN